MKLRELLNILNTRCTHGGGDNPVIYIETADDSGGNRHLQEVDTILEGNGELTLISKQGMRAGSLDFLPDANSSGDVIQ